ncbi:hypothetical protein Bca52824_028302 [Brassica carinata]|uniref:Uncharacterized protein n=1 Tax=Brassica carinata TaxID=52824 RepID=A0A8X7VCC4_BRACI|nr:hypothetical protein Bca52824_028302 [Brassica carinata]
MLWRRWREQRSSLGFDGGDVERFEGFDMFWPVGLMEVRGVGEVRGKGEKGAFIMMLDVASLIFVCGIANHLNAPYLCKKDGIVLNCPDYVKESPTLLKKRWTW